MDYTSGGYEPCHDTSITCPSPIRLRIPSREVVGPVCHFQGSTLARRVKPCKCRTSMGCKVIRKEGHAPPYRGTSLIRPPSPEEPLSRPTLRDYGDPRGAGVSYERGTTKGSYRGASPRSIGPPCHLRRHRSSAFCAFVRLGPHLWS